jgi:hypothetical protein
MEENNVPAYRRTNFSLNIASGFSRMAATLAAPPRLNSAPGVILQITI